MVSARGLSCALLASLAALGCSKSKPARDVDFHDLVVVSALQHGTGVDADDPGALTVCIAPIFPAQEEYGPYLALVRHIERKSGIAMRFVYPDSYRDALQWIEDGGADLAFTCTGMYAGARNRRSFDLLATPVSNGGATTRAYIIVAAASRAKRLEDLRKSSFAFVDDLSLTGYLYPVSRLGRREGLPVKTIFSGSHESSIRMVRRGVAEGASVDGVEFDRIASSRPAEVENVRVLEKSQEFGMPPVVVSTRVPGTRRALLLGLLTGLDSDSTGRALLRDLRIEKYIPADEKLYEPARVVARDAELR